jgi:hypothetical protein
VTSRMMPRKRTAWFCAFGTMFALATLGAVTLLSTFASASTNVSIGITSECASSSSCTSFVATVTNSSPTALDGLSVEVLGGAVSLFQLNGYLTNLCKQNSSHTAFVCFPFSLAPGATLRGSGVTGVKLTSTTEFRMYTTANGFATSSGQTVPLAAGTGYPLTTPAVVGTSQLSGAGLLIGVGIAILIISAGGIGVIVYARRRLQPNKCAAELESLKNAETALRYWETAIESVQRDVALSPGDAELAEKLHKAQEGYDVAFSFRDQCQLNVMHSMTFNK